MEFKNKTAVVTGASGGIGRAVAVALAKAGCDVFISARNTSKLEEVKKEIEAAGRGAASVKCDVTQNEDVWAMAEAAITAFGSVDILINNAGVAVRGLLENMAMPDWEFIVNTNLLGYVRCVQAFLPHFMAKGSGYIVNVSSIQALAPSGDNLNIPYITTKAGILGFTEALYGYLRPKGILVSCTCPGAIATDMGANARFVGSEEEKAEMAKKEIEFFKMPFFVKPEAMAENLLESMKKEEFISLIPARMEEQLGPQGRDVHKLNAYLAGKGTASA